MLRALRGHRDAVLDVAFSADGARIVTASEDRTARVWDAASGEVLREFTGYSAPVLSAAFSSDGVRVVTASSDGTVRVWDVSLGMTVRREELVRRVCTEKLMAGRAFTTDDAADPILAAVAGKDPCERLGQLSLDYWTRMAVRVHKSPPQLAPAL
jgi:WD40 repeat protein